MLGTDRTELSHRSLCLHNSILFHWNCPELVWSLDSSPVSELHNCISAFSGKKNKKKQKKPSFHIWHMDKMHA